MILSRKLAVAAALVLSVLVQPATGRPVAQAKGNPGGLNDEQKFRKDHQTQVAKEHSDRSGRVRPDLWKSGIDHIKQMKIVAGLPTKMTGKPMGAPSAGGITGVQWTQIGPAPLRIDNEQNFQGKGPDSGEVVDIAVDPRNSTDQTIYIATNDGGIWKSTDGGSSWKPKTDFMPSLSMGAVVLDPSNPSIVYAGTGNPYDGGGVFSKGVGIYRSTDGGDTWSIVGANIFTAGISRMAMPAANVLMVAAANGLYRSVDGGANFGNNSPLFNNGLPIKNGNFTDIAVDTASANTVYAASSSGLFQSTDGGATFPTNLFPGTGGPTCPCGYVSFSQSTNPDNKTIYADVQRPSYDLYKSTDTGTTWTKMTAAETPAGKDGGCQCGYDQTVGVDPQDANRVYIGFQQLWLSTDGGSSFGGTAATANQVHFDNHALRFSPSSHWGGGGAPTRLYTGTDGGIATSGDGGSNWSDINEGIATNLLNSIDIGRGSSMNNQYTYGGAQDTGVSQHAPGDTGTDWHLHRDGDGGRTVTDPSNPKNSYSTDDGIFVSTNDGGSNWPFATSGGSKLPDCGGNFAGFGCGFPVAVDPNDSTKVYAANGSQLFQSTDTGSTWTSIKTFPSSVVSGAIAKIDSNTMWVGLSNGTVQRTNDLNDGIGATWTSSTVTGAPFQGAVVAVDPSNTAQVVVVYAGFCSCGVINRTQHVFMTSDNGSTWTDISGTDGNPSGNLPDLPLHSVVIDPDVSPHAIIVSSDAGVFRSADNGASWQVLGVGLPTVDSTSLQLDTSANPSLLRIGTYGRSAFELTAANGPLLAVNSNLAFGTVPVGGNSTSIVQLFNVGSTDLHISSFSRVSGSTDFTILSGPPTPVTITPGEELDYTIKFAPTAGGNEQATFQIISDAPNSPLQLSATGTGGVPVMTLGGDLNFGTVARGTSATRAITVFNTGNAPLQITTASLLGDSAFSVLGPSVPQTIAAGEQIAFTVQFAPPANSNGNPRSATFTLGGNDALFPSLVVGSQSVTATGTPGVPVASVASSALSFGNVPVDDRTTPYYADQTLRITNQASCPLCDLNVTSLPITGTNAGDFTLVSPPSLPAKIGAGNHLDLTVRFNPSDGGARSASLAVNTDDPANPSLPVTLAGTGLMPGIRPAPSPLIFPPTVFSPMCTPSCGTTLNETITDSGQAELILDGLSIVGGSGSPFSAPGPTSPVTRVAVTNSFVEPVTFKPTSGPQRKMTDTLHIQDNVMSAPLPVAQDVPLCGESVGRGIRVLVVDATGNPVSNVGSLQLQSHGLTHPVNIKLKNLPLQTISPPTSCQTFQMQYENQNLEATETVANRGSNYILTVTVGSKHTVVSFTLNVNEFKLLTVTVQ